MGKITDLITGKYRKQYAEKYGIEELATPYDIGHWNDREAEKMYKECLDKGVTWRELKGVEKPTKDMIL